MSQLQQEAEHFDEALERPPAERDAFIRARHAGDPALVKRLLRLVEAHERAERAERGPSVFAQVAAGAIDATPERIGPYRVLEVIGEGGMGVVYAAEQTEPLRRRVAVKVIRLGMDSREVLARFEAERQALAMMDHPGVARALDAGVTEQGRPYFVMELVRGLPLIEYCATHRVPLRERLRLFVDVCTAIQHAHQKGIIHRDLKPSNILVALHEGVPAPKVIDFGVAKATAARLSERTVFTEQGRLIGTPEYMSPEQAEMSGLDVDTRTDVYSLGVILYELLTGVVPFDAKALRSGGYAELLRTIREVEPARPSSRITKIAREGEAAPRALDIQARSIRGELDWIVMKAIAKDRTRRYGTASALAEDVERYLKDLPVLAGPPSAAYAVRKFVRRHRSVTALLGLALVSVGVGIAGLSVGLVRARQAEALATRRARNALATADFLEQLLFQADPEFAGRPLSLDDLMDVASRSIDEELGPYPEVEASVRESIGVAYRRRSLFDQAGPHLRRSLEIRRSLFGERDAETAPAQVAMANLVFEHEGDVGESIDLLTLALDAYAAQDPQGLPVAWVELDIGHSCLAGDRLDDAARAFEISRELLARHRGERHPDVSRPLGGLAMVALGRGDLAEGERLARLGVSLCEGESAVYIGAQARLVLARVLIEAGKVDEAGDLLEVVAVQFDDTVGDHHIRIAELDATWSELHLRRGEFDAAEGAGARCEALRRALLHEDHPAILEARLLVQLARIGSGRYQEAEGQLEQIGRQVEQRLRGDHPLAIRVASAFVECARGLGDETLATSRGQRLARLLEQREQRQRGERGGDAGGVIGDP